MIYFHLLVLTYTIDGNDTFVSKIAFRDQSSCANAMDEIIRPKPRPTK